jgi:ABC-type multidrug transport system fused ATPase/permease subunit
LDSNVFGPGFWFGLEFLAPGKYKKSVLKQDLHIFLQIVGMTHAAEKLVMRLRLLAFINILRQAVGWFDLEQNSAGVLITRLSRDAPLIKGVGDFFPFF